MASKICIKRLLLWKFILRYFILAFFLFPTLFYTFPHLVLAQNPPTSSSLLSAYDAYVNEQVPVSKTDVITGYSDYISEPLKLPPVSQTPITISTVSESSLLPALRTLLARQEFVSLLRGPQGEQGAEGPQGLPAPSSLNNVQGPIGYNFGTTAPSAPQNNPIGTLGGFTALGAQDLTSTTIHVTGDSTFTGNVSIAGIATIPTLTTTTGTADTLTVGGGYGSPGVTISNVGNISANGALIIDGASTFTGNTAITGNATVGGTLTVTGTTPLHGLTIAHS